MNGWLPPVLAVLATWRVTHLLASEDGPANLIVRFRRLLGNGAAGRMMDCFNCLSLWVAAPIALCLTRQPIDLAMTWLGLSGAACLLERIGREPTLIQPIVQANEEEVSNGVLRSAEGFAQQYAGGDADAIVGRRG